MKRRVPALKEPPRPRHRARFLRLADRLRITRPRRRPTGPMAPFISLMGARLIAGCLDEMIWEALDPAPPMGLPEPANESSPFRISSFMGGALA